MGTLLIRNLQSCCLLVIKHTVYSAISKLRTRADKEKLLVPCIWRVIPKHVKDPSTFIEKSRVQYPTMLVRYHTPYPCDRSLGSFADYSTKQTKQNKLPRL